MPTQTKKEFTGVAVGAKNIVLPRKQGEVKVDDIITSFQAATQPQADVLTLLREAKAQGLETVPPEETIKQNREFIERLDKLSDKRREELGLS